MIFNTLSKCIENVAAISKKRSDTEYKTTSQNDIAFILFSVKKRTISMSKQFRLAVY